MLLFHCFPGAEKSKSGMPRDVCSEERSRRKAWLNAIRQDEKEGEFMVKDYVTVVCSDHFRDEDYSSGKCKGGRLLPSACAKYFPMEIA